MAYLPGRLSLYSPQPLQDVSPILVGSVTTTGATAAVQPFNSSLFLQRIYVPASMSLSEVDLAIGVSFPAATSAGQGTVSQSVIFYSFGNSTSLASVLSFSGSSSWTTGSATQAGQSYSQSQVAWSGLNVKPMTFAASSLQSGDLVVGHLIAFAGASTSWTVSLFGYNGLGSSSIGAVTGITSATLSAASTFATNSTSMTAWSAAPTSAPVFATANGVNPALTAASAHTASGSAAITAFSAAPTVASVLVGVSGTSTALTAASAHTASGSAAITAFSAAPTVASVLVGVSGTSTALSAASAFTASGSAAITAFSAAPTAASVMSSSGLLAASGITGMTTLTSNNAANVFWGVSRASSTTSSVASATSSFTFLQIPIVEAIATLAGSILTASGSNNVISNAGTGASSFLSTNGLLAGSFFTASTSVAAFTGGTGASSFLSTNGLLAGSFFTASTSVAAFTGGTGASSFLSTNGLLAGSFFTASSLANVFSNAGTIGAALALSLTTNSIGAVTAVGPAALSTATFGTSTIYNFGFIGTQSGSTTSAQPFAFLMGVMSTGAAPSSIALSSSAVTATGSLALLQPWFALAGA